MTRQQIINELNKLVPQIVGPAHSNSERDYVFKLAKKIEELLKNLKVGERIYFNTQAGTVWYENTGQIMWKRKRVPWDDIKQDKDVSQIAMDIATSKNLLSNRTKMAPFQLNESKDRGHCIFPKEHSKVNDRNDHFPINDINNARNALAQAAKYDKAPEWYDGSLEDLLKTIRSTIEKEFPSIEISETLQESLARTQSLFISLNEAQRNEFQSSVVRGGSIIPEVVVIENGVLTWSKRKINLIGKDVKSVKVSDVTQMDLNIGIISTDFVIYTKGNNIIEGHNFSKQNAMAIKKLLKV